MYEHRHTADNFCNLVCKNTTDPEHDFAAGVIRAVEGRHHRRAFRMNPCARSGKYYVTSEYIRGVFRYGRELCIRLGQK